MVTVGLLEKGGGFAENWSGVIMKNRSGYFRKCAKMGVVNLLGVNDGSGGFSRCTQIGAVGGHIRVHIYIIGTTPPDKILNHKWFVSSAKLTWSSVHYLDLRVPIYFTQYDIDPLSFCSYIFFFIVSPFQ